MLSLRLLNWEQHLVKAISIVATVLFSFAASYCIQLPTSNSFGYMMHVAGLWGEDCKWVFDYNLPNRTNLMMVFRVLKSDSSGWAYDFYTPDNPGRKWWQSGTFCRIYVKSGSNLTNCKSGDKRPGLCKHVIQKSKNWPPMLKTGFASYSAVMSYQFIDCEANTTENRTLMAPNIVVEVSNTSNPNNMTIQKQNSTHYSTQIKTTPGTALTSATPSDSRGQSATPVVDLWVAVVLGTLLAFAVVMIVVLLIKLRGKSNSSPKSSTVNSFEPQAKEEVDNVLYTVTN